MKAQQQTNKQLQALLRPLKPKPDHLRTSVLQQVSLNFKCLDLNLSTDKVASFTKSVNFEWKKID